MAPSTQTTKVFTRSHNRISANVRSLVAKFESLTSGESSKRTGSEANPRASRKLDKDKKRLWFSIHQQERMHKAPAVTETTTHSIVSAKVQQWGEFTETSALRNYSSAPQIAPIYVVGSLTALALQARTPTRTSLENFTNPAFQNLLSPVTIDTDRSPELESMGPQRLRKKKNFDQTILSHVENEDITNVTTSGSSNAPSQIPNLSKHGRGEEVIRVPSNRVSTGRGILSAAESFTVLNDSTEESNQRDSIFISNLGPANTAEQLHLPRQGLSSKASSFTINSTIPQKPTPSTVNFSTSAQSLQKSTIGRKVSDLFDAKARATAAKRKTSLDSFSQNASRKSSLNRNISLQKTISVLLDKQDNGNGKKKGKGKEKGKERADVLPEQKNEDFSVKAPASIKSFSTLRKPSLNRLPARVATKATSLADVCDARARNHATKRSVSFEVGNAPRKYLPNPISDFEAAGLNLGKLDTPEGREAALKKEYKPAPTSYKARFIAPSKDALRALVSKLSFGDRVHQQTLVSTVETIPITISTAIADNTRTLLLQPTPMNHELTEQDAPSKKPTALTRTTLISHSSLKSIPSLTSIGRSLTFRASTGNMVYASSSPVAAVDEANWMMPFSGRQQYSAANKTLRRQTMTIRGFSKPCEASPDLQKTVDMLINQKKKEESIVRRGRKTRYRTRQIWVDGHREEYSTTEVVSPVILNPYTVIALRKLAST